MACVQCTSSEESISRQRVMPSRHEVSEPDISRSAPGCRMFCIESARHYRVGFHPIHVRPWRTVDFKRAFRAEYIPTHEFHQGLMSLRFITHQAAGICRMEHTARIDDRRQKPNRTNMKTTLRTLILAAITASLVTTVSPRLRARVLARSRKPQHKRKSKKSRRASVTHSYVRNANR